MFTQKRELLEHLTAVYDDLLIDVKSRECDSEAYAAEIKHIETLHKLLHHNKISWDVLITAAANIAGILLVLNYERLSIVTSKAFGLIMKPKH